MFKLTFSRRQFVELYEQFYAHYKCDEYPTLGNWLALVHKCELNIVDPYHEQYADYNVVFEDAESMLNFKLAHGGI